MKKIQETLTTKRSIRTLGFTLIELLVVISIISLLSSIVLGALGDARAKARDARRISDMQQIKNALELYYSKYGYYPVNSNSLNYESASFGVAEFTSTTSSWNTLESLLNEFIPSLPKDPKNIASGNQRIWSNSNVYNYTFRSGVSNNNSSSISYGNNAGTFGCKGGQHYFLATRLERPQNTAGTQGPSFRQCNTGELFNSSNSNWHGVWITGVGK